MFKGPDVCEDFDPTAQIVLHCGDTPDFLETVPNETAKLIITSFVFQKLTATDFSLVLKATICFSTKTKTSSSAKLKMRLSFCLLKTF
jgi:hypothetical protein